MIVPAFFIFPIVSDKAVKDVTESNFDRNVRQFGPKMLLFFVLFNYFHINKILLWIMNDSIG